MVRRVAKLATFVGAAALSIGAFSQLSTNADASPTSDSASLAVAAAPSPPTQIDPQISDAYRPEVVPSGVSKIARVVRTATVYSSINGEPVGEVSAKTRYGLDQSLSVVGDPIGQWVNVRLDQRPNQSTGWLRLEDVEITWTDLFIVIDLSDRYLALYSAGDVVVEGTVAIGSSASRTPTGFTFVSEVLATPGATIYGPYALGLAMYSDDLTEYAGGNGQIAIHGTNTPELLGSDVSAGCVRTDNDLIRRLAGRVPLGTPVVIVA
ncbi:MAG: L,D-transpeptidase [Actinobacteria bacterium]|nr:L,D-transpeptidase [Actinomycetota bacterium]